MKTVIGIASLVLLGGFPVVSAAAANLAGLAWLAGCWASESAEAGSGEFWLPPAGDAMLGISRTVKAGKTTEHEFMQIRLQDDGGIAFIAQPSGQARAIFPAVKLSANEVVFENTAHDFPQRIVYRLEGSTRLDARIEGLRNGKRHVVGFPMRRVRCDPPAPAL